VSAERLLLLFPLFPALLLACTSSESAPSSRPSAEPQALVGLPEAEYQNRIAHGRELLDAGKPVEAEAVFAKAAAEDGESLRTRMWVLRAWMDQGRSNDTLDALDELNHALGQQKSLELDYLYGMAFARRAESNLAMGVTDSSVQLNFTDAKTFLEEVLRADPRRYRDAYLPLARAAWFEQDLETARWAADQAVEVQASPDAWLQRGRILMAEFASAEAEEAGGDEAEALWSEAARSFRSAVEAAGTPRTDDEGARLAEAATQLGHTMVWRQKGAEATDAYATAMAWNPGGFDYGRTLEFLRGLPNVVDEERPVGFRAALEQGRERLEARGPLAGEGAATLLWWLGWARFADAAWESSEAAFQQSLALVPEFANAWFYIGLSRQYRKDSAGAVAAMHAGWDIDPASMVATVASAGGALRAFEGLLGWCATEEPPHNLDAAFLAEMLAQAFPDQPRHWNNVGLFLRDEGERLEWAAHEKKTDPPSEDLLTDLYERSYKAYQRALELTPDDPQLINDTALMLHYHLDGELAAVEERYREALARCDALLADPELSEDDRARFEQTKKDIAVNLKALLEPEKEEEEASASQGTAAAASSGGQ